MINYCKVIPEKRTIIYDREFAKTAFIAGEKNYDLLQEVRRDYPNFNVEQKHINKKENQEHFKGMTYEFMTDWVEANGDEETRQEFRRLMAERKCHSIRYQTIFHWFRNHFDMSDYESINVEIKTKKIKIEKSKRVESLKVA